MGTKLVLQFCEKNNWKGLHWVFFTVVVYFYFQRMYTRYLTILIGGKREGNLWDLKEKFWWTPRVCNAPYWLQFQINLAERIVIFFLSLHSFSYCEDWSCVGRQGGKRQIILASGCWYQGTVVREMGEWHLSWIRKVTCQAALFQRSVIVSLITKRTSLKKSLQWNPPSH